MKSKDFNKICKSLSDNNGKFDVSKISNLSDKEKKDVVRHLIRVQLPIIKEFVVKSDFDLLAKNNYIYEFKNKYGYSWYGTATHKVRFGVK